MTQLVYKAKWFLTDVGAAPAVERRKGERRAQADVASGVGRAGFDRRKSVRAVLWCLPTMLATVAFAGERVQFDASHAFTAGHVSLRADVSRPSGDGPFPAVVLMHGCGGMQPAVRYTMNSYADYLVAKGFVVLSLDSFGPRNLGGGTVCESVPKQVDALEYRTFDAYDALRYLKEQKFVDARSIFLMGQSNGGSVAINVAKGDGLSAKDAQSASGYRAVVAFYPWCGSFGHRKVDLAAPLLVFGGAQDSWTPPQECQTAQVAGAALEVKVYPQAAHSFDLEITPQRYLGNVVGLNKEAADDSRERMVAFFMKYSQDSGWQSVRVAHADVANHR